MLRRLCHNALSHPKLYDLVQWAVGAAKVRARLIPLLTGPENQIVLDVGAGTGALRALLPENCRYIWMDNDLQKLHPGNRNVRPKIRQRLQVLRDAGILLHLGRNLWRLV